MTSAKFLWQQKHGVWFVFVWMLTNESNISQYIQFREGYCSKSYF